MKVLSHNPNRGCKDCPFRGVRPPHCRGMDGGMALEGKVFDDVAPGWCPLRLDVVMVAWAGEFFGHFNESHERQPISFEGDNG